MYKNTMKCKKCPKRNDEEGCPLWWEVLMTHNENGQKKVTKGCGFAMLPQFLALVSTNTIHATAASYDMRNKVIKNVGNVVRAVNEKLNLDFTEDDLIEMEQVDDEVKMIEEEKK